MLKYQFPAVKGCQAGKDYYICMVPLGLMSKIFATDSSDVPAEYRAQRKLNEARIPEICGYILSNRDSYVFSALAASVDGDMKFVPADSNENAGLLEIDMTASFLINDGQHRKAAIEAAIAEDESLKEETISIVLYKDQGLQRSQQMFTDLNKHAVTTSKSLNTLYESKDSVALITKNVVNSISFLRKYTDKEKDNLSKYSSNIFTLNTFYTANKRICKVIYDQDNAEKLVYTFWNHVVVNMREWNEMDSGELSKKSLREDYITTQGLIKGIYLHDTPENTIEHFFGGIVAVEKRIPGSNRQQRELIDGQQRITTTLLLIIALIRKYEKLKDVSNGTLIDNRINKLRQKYLRYDDEINREPITVQKLVLSKADKQYFEDLIEARECTERRDSHRRINRAFKKLEKFVAGIIDAEATVDAKIDALAKIENIVHNNCTIIFIDSKTRESAYKLFQVLNDRGAGLTEGDLLKSKTLEVLEKHFSIKQSTVQDAWDEILQDEPKQIEQFLRYYYASVCGSRVGRTSLYDDFLKQFFPDIVDVDDVSDEATATKIVDTVNQILREIRTYRKLIAGIWPYEVGQPLTDWDRKRLDILIRFLDFDIVYPLLLAAVQLKQKTFADLVHMLEKFMFRHKSVCNLGHQKLSELYMQEAVKIRRDPENYRLTGLRTTLKEYIETECTDAVFKVGLSNLKYRTNGGNKPLRYLFSTLNEHIEWYRNGAVGAPAPQKGTVINYDNVTIEHIASQSPSAAVPGFTSENIHTLSNLTLLTNGENDRAKNKSYTAKKAIYHDSEYVINKYFDSVDDWSVESAKAWEQYLQEMVCKVFVV